MAREPVDGDRDGRIYDGTPRERPAPVRLPKLPTADRRPKVKATTGYQRPADGTSVGAVVYHTNLAGDPPEESEWLHAGSRGQAADRTRQVEAALNADEGFSDPLAGNVEAADIRETTKRIVMFGRDFKPQTFRLKITKTAMNTPQTPVSDTFANAISQTLDDVKQRQLQVNGRSLTDDEARLVKLDEIVRAAEADAMAERRYTPLSAEGFAQHHHKMGATEYDVMNRLLAGEDPGPIWYYNTGEGLSVFGDGEFPKNEDDPNRMPIEASVMLPEGSYSIEGSHAGPPSFADPPAQYEPENVIDESSLAGVVESVNAAYPGASLTFEADERDSAIQVDAFRVLMSDTRTINDVLSRLGQLADREGLDVVLNAEPLGRDQPSATKAALYGAHGFALQDGKWIRRSRPTANRMLARPDVTRSPDDVPLFATADEARQPRSRSAHRRAEQAFRPVSGTIAKGEVESGVDQLASVRAVSREDRVAIGKAIAALPADKAKTLGLGKDHPVWDMARAGEWDDRYAFASLSPMFVSIRDPYADKPPLAERIARPMLAADYVETGMFPAPTTADQRALAERTRNRLQVLDDPTSQRIADEIDRTLTTGVPYTDAAGHYLLGQLEREQTAADTDRQSAMFGPSDPEAGVVRTIDELYEAIGVNALRKSIGSWNESSLSARMVLLQRGIAAEFGVPYDDSRVAADVRADLDGVFDAAPEAWQMVARTMYEDTQALLRDAGVSDLILYRGVDGDTETALTSPITSWSVSPNIGGMFGGRLWQAEVPATAIFATPMTGMGVPEEGELIVLAGPSVDERLVPPAERTGLPRMFDTWIDRDQGDVSALPDEPEPVVPGGPGASLPPSDVPADVAVKRNRVANIDTDRLVRRRQWIEDRIKRRGPDGVGLSGGRLGFAYRALEMQAIEDELDARQVPYERYTMTNAQVRERDATLRANRMRLDTEVSSEVVPTPERPLDVDLSSVTRKGKPAQWTYASGSKPMKVSGSYSRATVNARMKAVRRMMEDELPQLEGREFTIDYWLDWDEYRAAVSPDETGTYPMARWDEATNRVIISPSVATGLFDEGSEETWRTVMHELVHAASPQAVPNSGPEPVMEEGMAEILSIDIGARRVADFARLRSSGYAGGGRGETGLETLARNSVYKDRTAALILNAGERSGWDRRRTMAMLREWWESGSYQPVYRRIEYRSDGLDAEALRAKRRAEIDRRYDDLIRRLPQHSDEYEADRRRELADVDAETIEGDVSFRARQQWDQLTASARAAGVDLGRIRVDWTDEQDWVAESGLSAADQSVVDTTAASLLYWLVGGDDVAGTAAGESGAL